MKKNNNKSINYGFKILAILAFSLLIIPTKASADTGGYVTPYDSTGFNNNYNNNIYYSANQNTYQAPIYTPPPAPAATPIVYSNSTNPNAVNTRTAPKTVARTTTSNTVATTSTTSNSASGLAANAVYGTNSFLPSGLIQWILFAIFILLIVILSRIIFGRRHEYLSTPLKHE